MGGAEDFFYKIGGGIENVADRAVNLGFGLASIPLGMANMAQGIGNGVAGFLNSPLSGITIPLMALAAVMVMKPKF